MFAIIQTGGKQYRVAEGDTIRVEKLTLDPGAAVNFDSIFVGGDNAAKSATVAAEVVRHVQGEKIYIDKYKSGIQYRRRNGHRQQYTDIKITGIK
jgi:large subunit ribosomal protein L21